MEEFKSFLDQMLQTAWVITLLRILAIALGSYIFYRIIMSSLGASIRSKIGFLDKIHTQKQIRKLTNMGEYSQAGDLLLQIGKINEAIDVFQQGKLFSRAADVYLEKKSLNKAALMFERAGDLKKAGEIYIKQKQFDKAFEIFSNMDALSDLADMYAQNEEHFRAAEIYEKNQNWIEAARQYIACGKEIEAAKCLESFLSGFTDETYPDTALVDRIQKVSGQTAILYEKNKHYEKAAHFYVKAKNIEKASACLDMAGKHEEAGKLAKEHGLLGQASEYFKKANLDEESSKLEADHLYQAGRFEEAIDKYKEQGDFSKCAEIYTEVQDYHMAAQMHELAGEHHLAAQIFLEEKDFEKAGNNYEKASLITEALKAYQQGGLEHLELDLLSRQGRYLDVARYFLIRKLFEQALSALDRIEAGDPTFYRAHSIRGQIFYEQKDFVHAKQEFEKSLENTSTLKKFDLDTLFFYAKCDFESSRAALEILENKIATNAIDPSALEKAKEIRTMIQERSFSQLNPKLQSNISYTQSNPNFSSATPIPPSGLHQQTGQNQKRYQTLQEIGRGGMGVVYLAKDLVLDRNVALKILPARNRTDQRTIDTFLREAKAAAALNHPNIVTVFDTGIQDGDYYIAMEHIDGYTIKKILKQKGKFSIPVVKEVVKQLIQALSYAHKNNIVHRDLTTSNMMWTKQKLIKIMDFGLAKVVHKLQSEQSIIGGTPSFMSPEQTLGKPVDHRTDIYSLGICIFEMCLGSLPFTKGDLGYHHLHTAPPVASEIDPLVPKVLSDAILKCMEKEPANRYQSVDDLIPVLKSIAI